MSRMVWIAPNRRLLWEASRDTESKVKRRFVSRKAEKRALGARMPSKCSVTSSDAHRGDAPFVMSSEVENLMLFFATLST